MVSIDARLGAIKRDPSELLDRQRVMELCREHDYWPEADGALDPTTLIALFMRQVGAGNVSCDQVRLMGNDAFSTSGYCQMRMRMPVGVIRALTRDAYQHVADPLDRQDRHRWKGHRVLLIDATTFSMPDTEELRAHFGLPSGQKPGCGFPIAHVLMLFNARTGLAVDAITAPFHTHEMTLAQDTHGHMDQGDLVLGDDSFGTYAHLALLAERGVYGLFPAHHVRIVDFTPGRACIEPRQARDGKGVPRSRWVKSLGELDQIVEWFKPPKKPKWMTAEHWKRLPQKLTVREVRGTVTRPGFRPVTLTVVTTLLDPVLYPAGELLAMRLRRWDVETDLRHLKTTMGMEVLNCKTVEGVEKEMWMFLLIYNLARAVMVAAAKRQKVEISRISFASALGWIRCARDGDTLLRLALVPHRPDRCEPRAIKRRPKTFDLLVRPRHIMREEAGAVIGSVPSG